MAQEEFYIEFKRSGGFSGVSTHVEIHSRELARGDAEELEILIERSGFFEAFTSANSLIHMPDQFRYTITIEQMGRQRTLELSDGSVPDYVRPLINQLVRIARTRKMGQ